MRLTSSGRGIERYCDRDSSTELPPVPNSRCCSWTILRGPIRTSDAG